MCGITAIFSTSARPRTLLTAVSSAAAHRGPDGSGSAVFRADGGGWRELAPHEDGWRVGLAHERLSIIDLTERGTQPMRRDHLWITYNGEVYNYLELRRELEAMGHRFTSDSDTEVILAAYSAWGTGCFARFRGMWGLVIFDSARDEAILSRDRLGIKPLYIWKQDGVVAITSEIKQLAQIPQFCATANSATVAAYLQAGYERSERTFFRDVHPLPPGTWCRVHLDTLDAEAPRSYWDPERISVTVRNPIEAARVLRQRLTESVEMHLRSDVPVGCALSGGLDSGTIAVLASARLIPSKLQTFSCEFPGDPVDERSYIQATLDAIQAGPHFCTPTPQGFVEDLDRFVWAHDEPVGSLSVYAGYRLASETRAQGVNVTLNGQGGDEAMSGYWQSYLLHLRSLAGGVRLGAIMRHLAGSALPGGNPHLLAQVGVMLRRYRAQSAPGLRMRRPPDPERSLADDLLALDSQAQRVHQIRWFFLPRLLRWEDRNSMAFGVEGRYPFLDHEVLEACLTIDADLMYNRGWTKWPLRAGFRGALPDQVCLRREKVGFDTPQTRWMTNALKPMLEQWLTEDRPVWQFVDAAQVRQLAQTVWRNRHDEARANVLFRVFALDCWMERFGIAA